MFKALFAVFAKGASFSPQGWADEEVIRYRDIPKCTKLGLVHDGYPPVIGVPLVPRDPEFFCQRYADDLHQLINQLPLDKVEIDRLLMPVLTRLIKWVNIMPASETHHHSGACGLFVHSLQCAQAAVAVAEQRLMGKNVTLQQRYQDRPRWLLAAGVLGLIHDVGKVFDVEVVADSGDKWNPFLESMWQWAKRINAQRIFMIWRKDRVHKQHELRSVRLAYSSLFTDELITYFGEISGDLILGAIDDAVVFGAGQLGDVLKQAEAVSIQQDGADRKQLGPALTQMSSPLVTPILSAMRSLIETGLWSVNSENATVFVANQGTFVRLTEHAARDVHQKACEFQAPYVPATPDGLIRVMQEQNLLELTKDKENQNSPFWRIAVGTDNTRFQTCIKFHDAMLLFANQKMPSLINVSVCTGAAPANIYEVATVASRKKELRFLAPGSDFFQGPIQAKANLSMGFVSRAECDEVLTEAPDPQDTKRFVDRVMKTLLEQMRVGDGFLIEDFHISKNGNRICSSRKVEEILEKRRISQKTQEMLIRLSLTGCRLDFDPSDHAFTLKESNADEKSKSESKVSIGS